MRQIGRNPALALVLGLLPASFHGAGAGQKSALDTIAERGTLVVLCVPHQESTFVRTRTESGPMVRRGTRENFEGIDVDIMAGFAEHLGVSLELRPAVGPNGLPSYSDIVPALLRGDGDLAASSLSITEERRRHVRFSAPYFTVRAVVITRQDSGIATLSDLDGKVAGVMRGSSHEEYLRERGFSDRSLRFADFRLQNYTAVDEGTVDFTVVDSTSAAVVLGYFDSLQVAFPLGGEDDFAVAVPPGSDLLEPLNEYLEAIRASGELERIVDSHLAGKR